MGSYLAEQLNRRVGSTDACLTKIIPHLSRLALDHIGNSAALARTGGGVNRHVFGCFIRAGAGSDLAVQLDGWNLGAALGRFDRDEEEVLA